MEMDDSSKELIERTRLQGVVRELSLELAQRTEDIAETLEKCEKLDLEEFSSSIERVQEMVVEMSNVHYALISALDLLNVMTKDFVLGRKGNE